jgi:hypothetical protein
LAQRSNRIPGPRRKRLHTIGQGAKEAIDARAQHIQHTSTCTDHAKRAARTKREWTSPVNAYHSKTANIRMQKPSLACKN